jgi:hypothetical protein
MQKHKLVEHSDVAVSARVMQARLTMRKLEIEHLELAAQQPD